MKNSALQSCKALDRFSLRAIDRSIATTMVLDNVAHHVITISACALKGGGAEIVCAGLEPSWVYGRMRAGRVGLLSCRVVYCPGGRLLPYPASFHYSI